MSMTKEQPLWPYRILDLSDENGMLCGKILGDLGADVIKIEKPGGDVSRDRGPFYRNIPDREKSLFWMAYNTSKRSVTLNIETSDGREIFRRLAETADIIIETFSPGYMANLGLDYSVLSSINARVILVSITPFGQTGPYSNYQSCDIVSMAMGGLMYTSGDSDRAPLRQSLEQSYPFAGLQAAAGAMIALCNRNRTGEGEHVDVSIQECMTITSWAAPNLWFLNKIILNREGARTRRVQVVVGQVWQCKDGHVLWRLFTGTDADKTQALVDWMDAEGMAGELKEIDWETVDMSEVTQEQIDTWEEYWKVFFLTRTKKELYKEAVNRGIMLFPVNDFKDLYEDEQLRSRNFWAKVKHPELADEIVYPGAPFKSEDDWWDIKYRAPLTGEHNEDIYKDELGYSEMQLSLLKARHVI